MHGETVKFGKTSFSMRTDMTKLTVAFRNFSNTPKKNVTEVCATVEHIGTVKGNEQL